MKMPGRTQTKEWKRKVLLMASLLGMALSSVPARAADDVPFVVEAIEKSQEAPTAEGRWQVTATVAFTSESDGKMVASGPINVAMTPEAALKGVLPMTINDGGGDTNALGLTVKRDGTVGIQWLIAGKPYLGRPTMVFEATPFPDYLSKSIRWGGAARRMKLTLVSQWIKAEKPKIRVPKGETRPPIRKKREPIGKRYKITGRAVVTNADDGVGDNTVEVMGSVTLKSRLNGVFSERELIPFYGYKRQINGVIPFVEAYADLIFADPRQIHIGGSFVDRDTASGNDGMWTGNRRYSLDKAAARDEIVMPGDRDSENIEVYFTVTEVEDLY